MATQPEDQQSANPVAVIRQNLTAMAPEFKAALPSHVSVEKFSRVAMTAIQNTPALVNADRRSLFGAFVRLAQDGLLPDGREAAIVMFGNKAQAMPMIAGILKKIRQSGEVAKVSAQVVYANDKFVVKYGFDEDVEHIPPALNEPRGEPIGAYATAVLKDGSQLLEVMSLEQIEAVRKVSRAGNNGPWVTWFGEMARKTVMRRLSKRLPMSTDLEDEIFSRDETMVTGRTPMRVVSDGEELSPTVSRLDAIEHQIEPHDEETGELAPELAPEVPAEIEAQADELEAAVDEANEQREDAGLAGEASSADIEITAGLVDEESPAAKADAIIAEVNGANAIIDVNSIASRHKKAVADLPATLGAKVIDAVEARKAAIKAERESPPADPLRATLRQIEDAKTLADVDRIDSETEAGRAFLGDAQLARLDEALSVRRGELRAAEAV